jgi:hypothetical protein
VKIVTICGLEYAVSDGITRLAMVQEQMKYVGQVVKFHVYDITKDPPVFVEEYDKTVTQRDLDDIAFVFSRKVEE